MLFTGIIGARKDTLVKLRPEITDIPASIPEYLVTTTEIFRHAVPGDSIRCKLKKSTNSVWTIASPVYIFTGLGNQKTVIDCLVRIFNIYDEATKKWILKVPVSQIYSTYHHFKNKCLGQEIGAKTCSSVSEYLTLRSAQAWEGDKMLCVNLVVDTGLTSISEVEVAKLLHGWHLKHDRRVVLLLGLTYTEIEESYIYSGVLYEKLVECPYTVSCITPEKAKDIYKLLGLQTPPEILQIHRLVGTIIRAIRKETIQAGGTCILAKTFFNKYETYDLRDKLLKDYDVVVDSDHVYLKEIHHIEVAVVNYLIRLVQLPGLPAPVNLQSILEPNKEGYYMDSEQQAGVRMALTSNLSILTGQAGTGKTTCVRAIVQVFQINQIPFLCLAPTGRACAVMQQYTGVEALTIHMLITCPDKYMHINNWIVDESSMISLHLLYRFVRTIPSRSRIIMVGDPNQLQPIDWGRIFEKLIASECIPIVKLRTIYRVKTKGGQQDKIIENSKRIVYWKTKAFDFVEGDNFKCLSGDVSTVTGLLAKYKGAETSTFIVICPFRDLDRLNRAAQVMFNFNSRYVSYSETSNRWKLKSRIHVTPDTDMGQLMVPIAAFHVGDKVMMKYNNYTIKVMNGTEGKIIGVTRTAIKVDFSISQPFDDSSRVFEIPLAPNPGKQKFRSQFESSEASVSDAGDCDTNDLCLAFAITAHQSQGSQWKHVIYYIPKDKSTSLHVTNKLTYTAITRAEESITIVSSHNGAANSVVNKPRPTVDRIIDRLQAKLSRDYPILDDDEMEQEFKLRIAAQEAEFESKYAAYGLDDYDDY